VKTEIVVSGVGGQGVLLLAETLGTAAVLSGLDVRVSEIHGMAQRGGSVVCHVRMGEKIYSPTVMEGQADAIVALEPLEALRVIRYASEKTTVLMNTRPIAPAIVVMGAAKYPDMEVILDAIRRFTTDIIEVDAVEIAEKAGSPIAANMVMLGALASTGKLPTPKENIEKAIENLVPERYKEINIKAFQMGMEAAKKQST